MITGQQYEAQTISESELLVLDIVCHHITENVLGNMEWEVNVSSKVCFSIVEKRTKKTGDQETKR